jgi:hypothetical protein
MDKNMVEQSFKAIIKVEEELGLVGKSSFVETIYALIEFIDDRAENVDLAEPNISHVRVRMENESLISTVESVEAQLRDCGLQNLFTRGTTSTIPKALLREEMGQCLLFLHQCRLGLQECRKDRDFGAGLYCFRGDIISALSSAVDRSFLDGNPCVIVYTEPSHDVDEHIVDVNEQTIDPRSFSDFDECELVERSQESWEKDNMNWKTYVFMARGSFRSLSRLYNDRKILMGWLHDASTTEKARKGGEPTIDSDRSIQYCVQKDAMALLGTKMMVVEFVFDSSKWAAQSDDVGDILELWNNHMIWQTARNL